MAALLDPANRRREGIKWGLVIYTTVMFAVVTGFTATNLDIQSISYIDNREYPGNDVLIPGPLGYEFLIYSKPLTIICNLMFLLNNWMADGLLVSPVLKSLAQVSNVSCPTSSTVVTSSMP